VSLCLILNGDQKRYNRRYSFIEINLEIIMQFVVKLFPEITIKSRPVRKRFVGRLGDNIRTLLKAIDAEVKVKKEWDRIVVTTSSDNETINNRVCDQLQRIPGIDQIIESISLPFIDLDDTINQLVAVWGERLAGKTFVVRCKRTGTHEFNSSEAERKVGGGVLHNSDAAGVDLHTPDLKIQIEIRHNELIIIKERTRGLGGFPIGTIEPVMSLISGGFDSTVSSYMAMKRGLLTHYCFFNLGGREHELAVKEIAHYLWSKYGASHRVKFVSVPFEGVVEELLTKVDNSQMGVILKRQMMRAAAAVAAELEVQALVTGEAVAQVSSQTVPNLDVIDKATDALVMRPLVMADKGDIIRTATAIGTADFAAAIPEYCGVISVNPTTRAKLHIVEKEEARMDAGVLDNAIKSAKFINIDELAEQIAQDGEAASVDVTSRVTEGQVILDIRHPDEVDLEPLEFEGESQKMPFFKLHRGFGGLDRSKTYLLYCKKGVMSKLHAQHLVDEGFTNVGVYRFDH